ncbi:hypothetical protein V8C43DRAFT_157412 [Trichoderma afarasin]
MATPWLLPVSWFSWFSCARSLGKCREACLGRFFFLEFAARDWRLAPRLGRQAIKCSLSGRSVNNDRRDRRPAIQVRAELGTRAKTEPKTEQRSVVKTAMAGDLDSLCGLPKP